MLVSPSSACRMGYGMSTHLSVMHCRLDSKPTLMVLSILGSRPVSLRTPQISSYPSITNSGSARPSVPWARLLSPLRFAASWGTATFLQRHRALCPSLYRLPLPSEARGGDCAFFPLRGQLHFRGDWGGGLFSASAAGIPQFSWSHTVS